MKQTTIFIAYNPGDDIGRTLAIRLHTIGAVNGFRMYLPDRETGEVAEPIQYETQRRINSADYMVLFSTKQLSKSVIAEIETAHAHFPDPSRIIVVYDKRHGKNIKGGNSDIFGATYFDPMQDGQGQTLQAIVNKIFHHELWRVENEKWEVPRQAGEERRKKEDSQSMNALLGVGLGLFALAALAATGESSNKKK